MTNQTPDPPLAAPQPPATPDRTGPVDLLLEIEEGEWVLVIGFDDDAKADITCRANTLAQVLHAAGDTVLGVFGGIGSQPEPRMA